MNDRAYMWCVATACFMVAASVLWSGPLAWLKGCMDSPLESYLFFSGSLIVSGIGWVVAGALCGGKQ